MTTTASYKEVNESYLGTLCSNAYYEGGAGTIRDAVLMALQFDTSDASSGRMIDAAEKLTRDAMGLLETSISLVHDDWLNSKCDWNRIDEFFSSSFGPAELFWMITQLEEQQQRVWKIYFEHAGAIGRHLPDGELALGHRWHHDLALAATFLQAAALLLKEAED
jgi:hypothetical protein